MYLVTEGVDYTNVSMQNNLVKLVKNVQNSTWVEPPVYSWFEDFSLRWVQVWQGGGERVNSTVVNQVLEAHTTGALPQD